MTSFTDNDGIIWELPKPEIKQTDLFELNDIMDTSHEIIHPQILGSVFKKEMPNPTEDELNSIWFNKIWSVIKNWDVNCPDYYNGYCGANGSHVMMILNALDLPQGESEGTTISFDSYEQWK